jgi:hypothetical protein
MKLAAIYNLWDGVELLRGSMKCMDSEVDLFIIQYQNISNFGESYSPLPLDLTGIKTPVILSEYFPVTIPCGAKNETRKRNHGLYIASVANCTHFLHVDCDEYYKDFAKAKQEYINSGKSGSVCKIYTYFKKPTIRFENEDNYFVPFIHELKRETTSGVSQYPFYVDPTRRINQTDIAVLDIHMHHFSYVRNDIERKIRNSSAKSNIEKSGLLNEYNSEVGNGSIIKGYHNQKLIEVENYFGI